MFDRSFINSRSRRARGSILAVSLVVMSLAAIASLLMVRTLLDHQRLNERRRSLWTAFYAGEAGVAQVQQWALYPTQYTPNTALFASSGAGATFATRYPALYAAVHANGGLAISESTLEGMSVGQFTSSHSQTIGKTKTIQLQAPSAGDPVTSDFKILSTGRAGKSGTERRVLAYATLNPVINIKVPAALISYNGVGVNGNAKVHWGEAWSKNNMNMQAQNQYSYLSSDPKAIFRTEALINSWGGGWATSGKNPDVNLALTYPTDMGVKAAWDNHFYQGVPSAAFDAWGGWPTFDYSTFKQMALAHGRYYSTDAAGNIYRDGVEDNAHKVDFLTEFGVANHASAPYDLVFIDTTNGSPSVDHPPAADGSNIANINANGANIGLKGVYWLGANFAGTGLNNGYSMTMTSPYGTTANASVFLDGVMYTAGTMAMQGGTSVYGSIVAQKGFTGGGTPDIYYNSALASGIPVGSGNVGSPFKITLSSNY